MSEGKIQTLADLAPAAREGYRLRYVCRQPDTAYWEIVLRNKRILALEKQSAALAERVDALEKENAELKAQEMVTA